MEALIKFLPSVGVGVGVLVVLFVVNRLLERTRASVEGHQFRNQVIMIALTAASILLVILVIPMGDTMRGQVLGLIGIVLSAAIALSSTTFLGNAMAGVMLRAIRSFRTGDFIRAGEHFGRVSERGLVHTEIQTEDRELTTLPNLYLVTHPVTTVRSSGTIVSATVSLGYDVQHAKVEGLLLEAARQAELDEPFVRVGELGDFSITYRVAGLLTEVKRLLSARSRLRKAVLDALHGGGVEIVSPNFMNTRALEAGKLFIPQPSAKAAAKEPESLPEDLVFDKADEAESLEVLRKTLGALSEEIKAQEARAKEMAEGPERDKAEHELAQLQDQKERMEQAILDRESKSKEGESGGQT